MKKKILTILLAASMAVSAAPMALADVVTDELLGVIINADDESFEAAVEALGEIEEPYDEAENETDNTYELFASSTEPFVLNSAYDEVKIIDDCNDGEGEGAPDGSNYKISDGTYTLWNNLNFNTNYYVTVDFMYTNTSQNMEFRNKTDGGNYGAQFTVSGTAFKNTGGVNTTLYNSFQLNHWYKMILEGRMTVTGAVTYFSLYDYATNSTVVEPVALSLRNFASGSSNSCKFLMLSNGVCFDNEYAVQEYPNTVEITEANKNTSVDAGDSLQFSAIALRNGVSDNLTQPKISWSVKDVEADDTDNIKISDNGRLTVAAVSRAQTIKVVAAANSNGNPEAEYEVTINSRDISGEAFDAITVSGDENITAGGNAAYTFTAIKNGADVTSAITSEQVKWTVLDSTGSRELGNKLIKIENGALTVDKSVVGQTIRVRASTQSGYVSGDTTVTIGNATTETMYVYNACEEKVADDKATVQQGSWDGSSYYVNNTSSDYLTAGTLGNTTTSGDVLICADLKFLAGGSGITTIRRDGGQGLWLCNHNGVLAVQTGGSSYSDLKKDGQTYSLDSNSWYHIDLMFNTAGASLNIWKYNANGEKVEKATFTSADGLIFRSSQGFNRITVNNNTGIDNYMVTIPDPTDIEITDEEGTVITQAVEAEAGIPEKFGISASRDGLPMRAFSMSGVSWAVYDSDNEYPTADNDISASAGILSSNGLTKPQTVYLRATSVKDNKVFDSVQVNVVASNQFEITNVGYDENNENKLVRIFVNKLGDYKNDVVFIMTFFDENEKLVGSYSKKASGKNLKTGDNEIAIDYTLPASFDKATGKAKIMAWTALTTRKEPDELVSSFAVSYVAGTVALSNVPSIAGKITIAVYSMGTTDIDLSGNTSEKIVYVSQSDESVSTISLPDLTAGEYIVAVGGMADGDYAVHRATFTVE